MKLVLACSGILAATLCAPAWSEARPQTASPAVRLINSALDGCALRIVDRMFPDRKIKMRTELSISKERAELLVKQFERMSLEMQITSRTDQSLLATAYCEVNRSARVLSVAVRSAPTANLAAIDPKDMVLAMAAR